MPSTQEHAKFFLNRRGARLFGYFHGAERSPASDIGVVLSQPLSWEKYSSYRTYSHLARWLACEGFPTLHFDAEGCGDSDGDMIDVTIRSLVNDTEEAVTRLREVANCRRFVLIGVRLGASIAALVGNARDDVAGIGLIAPVTNGAQYWKQWVMHTRQGWLRDGLPLTRQTDLVTELELEGVLELDGELINKQFVRELQHLDLTRQLAEFKGACLLSGGGTSDDETREIWQLATALQRSGASVSLRSPVTRPFWLRSQNPDALPAFDTFERISNWLQELNRE